MTQADFVASSPDLRECDSRRVVKASASAASTDPGDDFRPNLCVRLLPNQYTKVLQAYAEFTRIFNDANVSRAHCGDKRFNAIAWCDIVRGVDYRECGRRYTLWTDQLAADRQFASAKAVLAVHPVDKLMDQFSRKRSLIECPALDSRLKCERVAVEEAKRGICQP
jgi:hypothetical protein